jgi:sigma-B regulation protein RsbU (phosphoserine phosphatase)
MINFNTVIFFTILYVSSLFLVAFVVEKVYPKKPKIINNPYVYTLTLAVYCTSWTFYGSVGHAASYGIDFVTIYIGPTLIVFTWWFLLKKIVRISNTYHINSIADFVSFRYGKSKAIGILVTIVCIFGVIPYIALQLKAINETASIITGLTSHTSTYFYADASFYTALIIGILGATFATIHLTDQRRHPGIIGVVAYESVVKLVIFLIAGFVITFIIFDGFIDILHQLKDSPFTLISEKFTKLITLSPAKSAENWFAMIFMSMMAVMFLPRQFHMTVVENFDEKHISKMMYLFPLYLFLINIFVLPIAFAGIVTFHDTGNPDYYSLSILLENKYYFLSVLVYIGGIAASTGMIIISSVSLANMFINNILLPISVKLFVANKFGTYLLNLRRLSIIGIILLAYFYYYTIGESFSLVSIGLASFAAICVFSPQILFGLFWKTANAKGAFYGILVGFLVWFYTVMIPYAIHAKFLPPNLFIKGICGLGLFKPTQILGITGLGFWAHAIFWILISNVFTFVVVSILTKQNQTEEETSDICLNILQIKDLSVKRKAISGLTIQHLIEILTNFFGKSYANEKIYGYLENIGKLEKDLTPFDLSDLKNYTEKCLSQAVGPGASKLILDSYLQMIGSDEKQVIDVFQKLVSYSAGESKETLLKKLSELNVMLEISRIFTSSINFEKKVEKVIYLLRDTFQFDEVILREKSGDTLFVIASTTDIEGTPLENFREIIHDNSYISRAIYERKQYAVNDISQIELNQYSAFLKEQGIVSFCHTPLLFEDKLLGVISTFSKIYKDIYTKEFLDILQMIANRIAFSIYSQRQNEELLKMNALTKEMEIAENIMNSLLPKKFPDVKGMSISASYIPSKYVGGDYYDYFIAKEGTIDFVIADVSGHNVASALIMTEFRSTLKCIIAADDFSCPADIITKLASEITKDLQNLEFIITLFYMRIDLKHNKIIYTNAGHNYPVMIKGEELIELKGGGPLLGMLDEYEYEHFEVDYEPGNLIYLYTDGVTESENQYGQQFGTERLYSLLQKLKDKSTNLIINQISNDLLLFRRSAPQKDDITMMVIKFEDE